jgi:hypothetical protein
VTRREEQRARNEALFRRLNERLKEIDDRLDTAAVGAPASDYEEFFCECGDLDCMARVSMTRAEYDGVREHPARFVVRPGHEHGDIEQTISSHDRFSIVEKKPEEAEIARATDPRS